MNLYKYTLLVIGFLLFTLSAFAEHYQVNVSSVLNVREEPNATSKVIGALKNGDIVEGVGATGEKEWKAITVPSGRTGYVKASYLKPYRSTSSHNIKEGNTFNSILDKFLSNASGKSKHLVYWILGKVLLMWFLCKFMRKITLDSITPKGVNNMAMRIIFITLLLVTGTTILYYLHDMGANALWFLQPSMVDSWWWVILNFVIFLYVFINLFVFYTETINDLSYVFRGRLNVFWGLVAWGIGIIAYVVCRIFNLEWIDYILWFELAAQGLQLLFIAYRMWKGGGIFGILVCWLVYLIGAFSLVALVIPLVYVALAIIAIIVILCIITKKDSTGYSESRNWKEWYGHYYETGGFGYIEDFAGKSHRVSGKHHGFYYTDDNQTWDENGHRI